MNPKTPNDCSMALFDGMLEAAGGNMSPKEIENLRTAHKVLMKLAERARPQHFRGVRAHPDGQGPRSTRSRP